MAAAIGSPPDAVFLAELTRLETVHDGIPKVDRRHNNKVTITGFKTLSTAILHPICNRHGQTYDAELNGSHDVPTMSLKFNNAPEHDPERPVVVDGAGTLNTDTVDAFISTVCAMFDCSLISRDPSGETWTLDFNVSKISMDQCAALLHHPSAAIIDVVLTLEGISILYSARSDSKNNLRYLKKHYPQYFVPKTAASDWMYEKSAITTAGKARRKKFRRTDRRSAPSVFDKAYAMMSPHT